MSHSIQATISKKVINNQLTAKIKIQSMTNIGYVYSFNLVHFGFFSLNLINYVLICNCTVFVGARVS